MTTRDDQSAAGSPAVLPGPPPLVLVVDDHPAITRAVSTLLRNAGYRVAVCHNGSEALECVAGEVPDAAVIDIHLPDLSGLILSAKLRQRFGDGRPIIICSGDTSMETIRSLPHVGETYFLSKPFRPEHLLDRLRALMAG